MASNTDQPTCCCAEAVHAGGLSGARCLHYLHYHVHYKHHDVHHHVHHRMHRWM